MWSGPVQSLELRNYSALDCEWRLDMDKLHKDVRSMCGPDFRMFQFCPTSGCLCARTSMALHVCFTPIRTAAVSLDLRVFFRPTRGDLPRKSVNPCDPPHRDVSARHHEARSSEQRASVEEYTERSSADHKELLAGGTCGAPTSLVNFAADNMTFVESEVGSNEVAGGGTGAAHGWTSTTVTIVASGTAQQNPSKVGGCVTHTNTYSMPLPCPSTQTESPLLIPDTLHIGREDKRCVLHYRVS
eukprot:GHVT01017054.1.p1 GENE.GHVT01017054.1~~GHVT01017054.1.p1  ORF type:complete len:243 (+),score=6.59 GHVT01017054.1:260-988(+)